MLKELDVKNANEITGGLSNTTKMPCHSYNLDARTCKVGSKLRKIKGSVCYRCYAYRGNYNYPHVKAKMAARFNAINHKQWAEAMAYLINNNSESYFRWHDSGDLQSLAHFKNIIKVCNLTKDVKHWLPTREHGIIQKAIKLGVKIPKNLIIRVSATMVDEIPKKIYAKGIYYSMVSKEKKAKGVFDCPSSKQDNKCQDCRACWDTKVQTISYKYH
jgi:hypothetical protein